MPKMTQKDAEQEINKGAENITENEVNKVINKEKEIEEKFTGNNSLEKFIAEVRLIFSLLKDYISGNYRKIPWWSVAAMATALLYVMNPLDIIPDFIPVVGYVDDAMVVAVCLKLVQKDLTKYKQWKNELEEE